MPEPTPRDGGTEHAGTPASQTTTLPWRPVLWPWTLWIASVLFLVGVTAAVAERTLITASFPGDDLLFRLLDLDSELSVGTWYSVAQLLVAAAVALVAARTAPRRSLRRGWAVFAVLMAAASTDEVVKIHEHLAGLMSVTLGVSAWWWVVPGAIVAAVVVAVLLSLLRELPRSTARRLLVGLGAFVTGALLLEGISGLAYETGGRDTAAYAVVSNLEELVEIAGIALVLRALALHLEGRSVFLHLPPDEG